MNSNEHSPSIDWTLDSYHLRLTGKGCDVYPKGANTWVWLENKYDIRISKAGQTVGSCHMDKMVAGQSCTLKN